MSKFTDRIDARFPYTPAAESAKPGYLKAKFDKIRRQLAEQKAAEAAKPRAQVVTLKKDSK